MIVSLIIALVCLALSAFFSGAETGLISINRVRLRHEAEEGRAFARMVDRLLENPQNVLAATLVGTNAAVVTCTIVLSYQLGEFWAPVLLTPVMLLFGEIIPKSLFRQRPNRLMAMSVIPLRVFCLLLYPVVMLLAAGSSVFARLFGGDIQRSLFLTKEDLRTLFVDGANEGAIEQSEREMIHSVMDFTETTVKEVMVPRIDMVAVSDRATKKDLFEVFDEHGHSRIPIYRDRVDNVVGVAFIFDLIRKEYENEDESIEELIRPVYYVPQSKKVDDLLRELSARQMHMAIVVDEYGGTAGFATVEDLVEEIFGEIQDEYDAEEPLYKVLADDTYIIEAKMDVEEANEVLGLGLPEKDFETVGGFILDLMGKIPVPGEEARSDKYHITVLEADEHSVSKVKIKLLREEDNSEPQQGS